MLEWEQLWSSQCPTDTQVLNNFVLWHNVCHFLPSFIAILIEKVCNYEEKTCIHNLCLTICVHREALPKIEGIFLFFGGTECVNTVCPKKVPTSYVVSASFIVPSPSSFSLRAAVKLCVASTGWSNASGVFSHSEYCPTKTFCDWSEIWQMCFSGQEMQPEASFLLPKARSNKSSKRGFIV